LHVQRGLRLTGLLGAAVLVSFCSPSVGPRIPGSASGVWVRGVLAPTLRGRFDHVIVIMQENRSLDDMFNGFPGAETVQMGMKGAKSVRLKEEALEPTPDHQHSHVAFASDYDGGKMDGFDHLPGPTAYTYVRASDVANYWTLGSRFTLADEVFQMSSAPSFAAHVYLVAAQGGEPWAIDGNEANKNKSAGCLGLAKVQTVDLRTAFPGVAGSARACIDIPTIFDLLDQKGLSWRYYAPDYGAALDYWVAPDYIDHIANGPDKAYLLSPETRVLDDIKNGTLPAVAYVAPEMCAADHPQPHLPDKLGGPHWVAAITNAIGTSAYWSRTLILVTWDDWGGFYDHVPPPIWNSAELGFRTPLLIISAYPRAAGAVDHSVRNQGSILAAIESIFGLGSLGYLDAQTDDLQVDFSFKQSPIPYGDPLPAATPKADCK
jgi:phospholipase C